MWVHYWRRSGCRTFWATPKMLYWLISKTFLLCGVKEYNELLSRLLHFGYYENKKLYLHKRSIVQLLILFVKNTSWMLIIILIERLLSEIFIFVISKIHWVSTCYYVSINKCVLLNKVFYCYYLNLVMYKDVWTTFPGVEDAIIICSNHNKPIWKNRVNIVCKKLTKICNINEWKKCTNHSLCQYGMSENHSLPGISMAESMPLARHKSANAHRVYIFATNNIEILGMATLHDWNLYHRSWQIWCDHLLGSKYLNSFFIYIFYYYFIIIYIIICLVMLYWLTVL